MTILDLPTRVARVGGAVKRFDEPRYAYKSVATRESGARVARLVVLPNEPVVYPARPAHAWNGNKLRARRVYVDSIAGPESVAVGPHARSFQYREGTIVESEDFCEDPHNDSAPGLYCFATREGAEHWGKRENARPWCP